MALWSQKHQGEAKQLHDEVAALESERRPHAYPAATIDVDPTIKKRVSDLEKQATVLEEKLTSLCEAMGMEFILQPARPPHWLAINMAAHKKG